MEGGVSARDCGAASRNETPCAVPSPAGHAGDHDLPHSARGPETQKVQGVVVLRHARARAVQRGVARALARAKPQGVITPCFRPAPEGA